MASITEMKSVPMLVVAIIFLSVSWLIVSLRIFVRGYMIRSFGWDDWLMIVAQFLFTVTCSMLIAISVTELTEGTDGAAGTRLIFYMIAIFGLYIITTVIFKLSLAIFFLRVVNRPWQRQIIYTSVSIYSVVGIVWFCVAIFQCGSPMDYVKNQNTGKCLDFRTVLAPFNYVHGILNAITDWIFAIVPIFVVRSAQMTPKAKASVIGILALGAAGSISSVVRLAYVNVLGAGLDKLYVQAPAYAIVSIIELGFGIIAASLATLRPLFARFLDKASNALTSSRSKRTRKTGTAVSGDHGIVMERSVNVGYSHELEAMSEKRGYTNPVDSGLASPVGKDFTVSVKASQPGAFSSLSASSHHHHLGGKRSPSHSSSERSLL